MRSITVYLALLLAAVCLAKVSFEGYSVARVHVEESKLPELFARIPDIDVWKRRNGSKMSELKGKAAETLDIMFKKQYFSDLYRMHIPFGVVTKDVQALIDECENSKPVKSDLDPFFEDFRTVQETSDYMDELVAKYPSLLTRNTIGQTFEGRNIDVLVLQQGSTPKSKAIYMQSMAHAREWLTMPTNMYILTKLLQGYTNGDETAKFLVENLDWHVVPLVNVDGYQYTHTTNRLWRKNRRRNSNGSFGVDLNRNYGPSPPWCTSGSSTNPSSDTYCGTGPFSEPEDQVVRDYLTANPQIKAGIDFHTYGSLLLFPYQWTYTRIPADDYQLYVNLGGSMQNAINAEHGQRYVNQQGSALYPHAGGFIDYNYDITKALAWTIELRGNGFVVDKSNIIPSGEENFAGMNVLATHVINN